MGAIMKASYESPYGKVELDAETVKNYLVKGNGKVTDQEVTLYIKMCEAQKLNPFVTGEVHLIKFGNSPAQMVIGYDTYKRRADDNPHHLYTESGIVVLRGSEVVQKNGACLYPTEKLVGGWCRVHRLRGEREVTTYKEVGFNEYNKGNAIWKEKPCTMIEKVAISQCLRESYPKDYEGLYTAEEIVNYPDEQAEDHGTSVIGQDGEKICDIPQDEEPRKITQEERKALFGKAFSLLGKEAGTEVIKQLMANAGIASTAEMNCDHLVAFSKAIDAQAQLAKSVEEQSEGEVACDE